MLRKSSGMGMTQFGNKALMAEYAALENDCLKNKLHTSSTLSIKKTMGQTVIEIDSVVLKENSSLLFFCNQQSMNITFANGTVQLNAEDFDKNLYEEWKNSDSLCYVS